MSEALKTYISMVEKITKPIKKLGDIKSPLTEVQDLLATGAAIDTMATNIRQTGSPVNSAALYDSASTIQTLSESVLVRLDSEDAKIVAEESKITAKAIRRDVDFEQANEHLFDYYQNVSDLAVVSKTIEEVCLKLAESKKPETLWDMIKNFFRDLKSRITEVIRRLSGIVGLIGQELASAVDELGKAIEAKMAQFVERLKSTMEKIHQLTLTLIRKMFKFLGEIQEIAKENKWSIKQILVEMPSCDVNVVTVIGFPVPIPKINTPKLTITFAPAE